MIMEVIDSREVLLANGNKMKGVSTPSVFELDSVEVQKRLQEHKEEAKREKQFCELIMHVIEKIEQESAEDEGFNNEPWPEISLLDMKKFIKSEISVGGVSENSPIIILESVSSNVGQTLHNFNIFELSQLVACTKAELNHIIKQAKGVPASDLEFAYQDAKSVVSILSTVSKEKDKETSSWNSWGGLSQVSNLLHIKENSKKIANLMETLSTKGITASFVDAFASQNPEDEDIETFHEVK